MEEVTKVLNGWARIARTDPSVPERNRQYLDGLTARSEVVRNHLRDHVHKTAHPSTTPDLLLLKWDMDGVAREFTRLMQPS